MASSTAVSTAQFPAAASFHCPISQLFPLPQFTAASLQPPGLSALRASSSLVLQSPLVALFYCPFPPESFLFSTCTLNHTAVHHSSMMSWAHPLFPGSLASSSMVMSAYFCGTRSASQGKTGFRQRPGPPHCQCGFPSPHSSSSDRPLHDFLQVLHGLLTVYNASAGSNDRGFHIQSGIDSLFHF